MTTYTGAWRRTATTQPRVRLVPGPDPQHASPDANPNGVDWIQSAIAPSLPDDMIGDQYLIPPSPLLLVDADVDTHEGTGNHAADLGSSDVRLYQPVASRDGGYHVAIIEDTPGMGDSPDTPRQRFEQGVGISQDPYARLGRRIARWRDRYVDMHRWGPEMRPALVKNAYAAVQSPPVSDGNQYTSPTPLVAQFGDYGVGTPDQLIWPVERRSPRPWDESATTDGSELSEAAYGLGVWGL